MVTVQRRSSYYSHTDLRPQKKWDKMLVELVAVRRECIRNIVNDLFIHGDHRIGRIRTAVLIRADKQHFVCARLLELVAVRGECRRAAAVAKLSQISGSICQSVVHPGHNSPDSCRFE